MLLSSPSLCESHSPVARLLLPEPSSWLLGNLWPPQRGHQGHRAVAISSSNNVLQRKDGLKLHVFKKNYILASIGNHHKHNSTSSVLWTHCAHCRWRQHPTRKYHKSFDLFGPNSTYNDIYPCSFSWYSHLHYWLQLRWRSTLNSPITASVLSERESHTCKEGRFIQRNTREILWFRMFQNSIWHS